MMAALAIYVLIGLSIGIYANIVLPQEKIDWLWLGLMMIAWLPLLIWSSFNR